MAMSPIRPELGRQDWSPVARGGQAFGQGVGQGLAQLGAGIGSALEKKEEARKKLDEQNKLYGAKIKSGLAMLDSLSTLPVVEELGMAPMIEQAIFNIQRPDETPMNQAAMADSAISTVSTALKMGTLAMQQEQSKPKPETPSATQEKIALILKANPDMPLSDAINMATGVYKTNTDPLTGDVSIVDMSTGTARRVTTESDGSPKLEEPEALTLWELAPTATGAANIVSSKVAGVTEQIGLPELGSVESAEAIQRFEAEQQRLINALRQSSRFLGTEYEALSREIDIKPSVFTGHETLRAKMRAVDTSLRLRMVDAQRTAQDTSLSADVRSAAQEVAHRIAEFLPKLGVPQDGDADGSPSVDDLIKKYAEG